jgi:hypothetical protein
MLTDRNVRLCARAVDHRWAYEQLIPIKVAGFNPLTHSIYYAAHSAFNDWLADPYGPARKHNFRDRLLREALMAAHDYLHVWAYGAIAQLRPELGVGSTAITRRNLEDMVFCQLLTEAVATVGLDYWYLAAVDLNHVCDLGTNLEGLTIGYHDRHLAEYRKFAPDIDVHSQGFFAEVVRIYCRGVFSGFSVRDVARSPLLFKWLHHELDYGKQQRRYSRLWLCHLAQERIELSPASIVAPVAMGARWQKALVREMGELLWDKVKKDKLLSVEPLRRPWTSPRDREPDFRFINLNRVGAPLARKLDWSRVVGPSFDYFFYQCVGGLDLDAFDPELVKTFELLKRTKDAALVRSVLSSQRRVPSRGGEPRDLFLLN